MKNRSSIFPVPSLKPRAKHLNEVLLSCKGGKMIDVKEYNRSQSKRDLKNMIAENIK